MTLTKRNPTTQLTANMAVAIFKRQYPGVPEPEIVKAGMICYAYGLFPYANQVFIVPFKKKTDTGYVDQWVTIIGIKGVRQIVQNTGHSFSYVDGPRVMTEQEEIEIYGARDQNYIRAIVKMKNRAGDIFPGYGNWRKSDIPYGQDKGNTPHNMAFIRAERNSLDKLAPGSIPDDIEIADSRFVDAPPQVIVETGEKELTEKAEKDADELWGDGKPIVHDVTEQVKDIVTPPKGWDAVEPGPEQKRKRRDPATIKCITDLQEAAKKDFGLMPAEVLKELGIASWRDLADASAAYEQIAAVR